MHHLRQQLTEAQAHVMGCVLGVEEDATARQRQAMGNVQFVCVGTGLSSAPGIATRYGTGCYRSSFEVVPVPNWEELVGASGYVVSDVQTGTPLLPLRGRHVSGIESEVLESFLLELGQNETVNSTVVEGLRNSLAGDKLPKPDQLVALYAAGSGDSLA